MNYALRESAVIQTVKRGSDASTMTVRMESLVDLRGSFVVTHY